MTKNLAFSIIFVNNLNGIQFKKCATKTQTDVSEHFPNVLGPVCEWVYFV